MQVELSAVSLLELCEVLQHFSQGKWGALLRGFSLHRSERSWHFRPPPRFSPFERDRSDDAILSMLQVWYGYDTAFTDTLPSNLVRDLCMDMWYRDFPETPMPDRVVKIVYKEVGAASRLDMKLPTTVVEMEFESELIDTL